MVNHTKFGPANVAPPETCRVLVVIPPVDRVSAENVPPLEDIPTAKELRAVNVLAPSEAPVTAPVNPLKV